ncbi:MAG: hypothetical protein SFV51_06320 [Bryobacteraceae bacterium]|nr:hypothetical protein [Bryobacteraceae bacterium]
MPMFFKGAGRGTFWHLRDARADGFLPQSLMLDSTLDRMMQHVARGSVHSPYVSLSRSFPVARAYALAGKQRPTAKTPAWVYEIELSEGMILELLDPLVEIAKSLPSPWDRLSYQHDGPPEYLASVLSMKWNRRSLRAPIPQPPPGIGTPRPPNLSLQLETMARAMRDAEVLVFGSIPKECVKARYAVY